jgi:MFS family permease
MLRQYEPKLMLPHQRVHLKDMLKIVNKTDFGKFIIFQTLISFAVAIASPFWAVYLLKDLNFSYTVFIIVMMTAPATKLIFMPLWGKFADRYGNRKVMRITGLIIWTVPFLWLMTLFFKNTHPEAVLPYLIFVEAITNFGWAGFELSSANYIFDGVSRENIPSYTAFFNILTNMGTFFGALLGGLLAMGTISFIGLSGILLAFVISGTLRLLVYICCIRTIKETRKVNEFDIEEARGIMNHMSLQQIIRLFR